MSPSDPIFRQWASDGLVWLPERGMGFYPVREQPYDAAYFAKYQGYAATDMGRALTEARIDFVARHFKGELVDIGIGCGDFVAARALRRECGFTFGYDVNPAGVEWLQRYGCWLDPYRKAVAAATFWDSLEHIADPAPILANIDRFVFVSLPIFTDCAHVLRSKHFRKDEHCWYWTRDGFTAWMAEQGWRLIEQNRMETDLGREDIETFAFERDGASRR